MLRNLIGTAVKGAMLGAAVIGAKKLWERRHAQPMKEPLLPGTRYNGTSAAFTGSTAADIEASPSGSRPAVGIDSDSQESGLDSRH